MYNVLAGTYVLQGVDVLNSLVHSTSTLEKKEGLAPDLIDIDAIESAINQNHSPDIEMIDEEIDRLIVIGLESSRWVTKAPTISEKDSTPFIYAVDKPKSADRIDSPISFPTQVVQEQSYTPPTSEEPVVVDLCISQASSITSLTNMSRVAPTVTENTKTLTCPLELLAGVEAEKRRIPQIAANIEACIVAINIVEAALATLDTGSQNNFVVSLKVYLRSAIAHFLRSGTAATTGSYPAVPIIKNAAKNVHPAKFNTFQAAQNKAGVTWATIAQKGHQKSPAIAGLRQNVPT
ncbi:putative eka-like protein [Erysiphe necator]|uniref:Putative eka-like protein n=1 Tax=Uncinula necator TaxID=52586 RepID=A0A0B1NWW7_UNCNE|nr:putative eka-like protein [Erysiphe necator]